MLVDWGLRRRKKFQEIIGEATIAIWKIYDKA